MSDKKAKESVLWAFDIAAQTKPLSSSIQHNRDVLTVPRLSKLPHHRPKTIHSRIDFPHMPLEPIHDLQTIIRVQIKLGMKHVGIKHRSCRQSIQVLRKQPLPLL
jgi:hypothetical protein